MTTNNPDSASSKPDTQPSVSTRSCRRNRTPGASFVQDLRDHFHEFLHASMDDHRTCLKNTLKKIFGYEKNKGDVSTPPAPAESALTSHSVTPPSSKPSV